MIYRIKFVIMIEVSELRPKFSDTVSIIYNISVMQLKLHHILTESVQGQYRKQIFY